MRTEISERLEIVRSKLSHLNMMVKPYFELGFAYARRIEPYAFFAVCWVICLSLFYRPPAFPESGLDPSWRYVLLHGLQEGMRFGPDLSFTGGPYSFLYSALFDPDLYYWAIASYALQATILTTVIFTIKQRYIAFIVIHTALFVLAQLSYDTFGLITCFSVFIILMNPRIPVWIKLLLSGAIGVFGLAKFSYMLTAICLTGLVDVRNFITDRRWPLFTPVYLIGVLIFWIIAGQNPIFLPLFIYNSIDVASGYSQAMANFGINSRVILLYYAFIFSSFLLLLHARPFSRQAIDWSRLAYWVGFTGSMILAIKSAVVRDGHDITAWQVLLINFSLAVLSVREIDLKAWALPLGATATLTLSLPFALPGGTDGEAYADWLEARGHVLFARNYYLMSVLNAPEMRGHFTATNDQAIQTLATQIDLGEQRTVGAAPWEFSALIASGYTMRFQPSVQNYSSYTSRLRRRDAAYFASDRSPDLLLLEMAAIDDREPAMNYGPSMLEIMRHYDYISRLGAVAALERRTHPRESTVSPISQVEVSIGEWLDLPDTGHDFLYLTADSHYTIHGKIEGFFLKFAHLWMDVLYANGEEETYRFIPSLGETGFIIPGHQAEAWDYFQKLNGTSSLQRPVAMRLRRMEAPFDDGIKDHVTLEFFRAHISGEAETLPVRNLSEILSEGRIEEAWATDNIQEGFLAHSPSRIVVDYEGSASLRGRFGFRPGTLDAGIPAPTVFRITLVHIPTGTTQELMSHEMSPGERLEDQRPFRFELTPPELPHPASEYELVFETLPENGNNAFGWTYWGNSL